MLQTPGGKRLHPSDSRCQNLRGNLQPTNLRGNLQPTTLEAVEGVVRLHHLVRQGAMLVWQRRARTACTNVSSTCAWTHKHRLWRQTLTRTQFKHHKLRQRGNLLSKKLNLCVHNNNISDACNEKLLL